MASQHPFRFEVDNDRLVDRPNSIEIRAQQGPEYTLTIVVGPADRWDRTSDSILRLYVSWTDVDHVLKLEVTDSLLGPGASNFHRSRMEELLEAAFSRLVELPYWVQFSRADLIVLSVPADWRNSLLNPPSYRQRLKQSLSRKPIRKPMKEVARRPVERTPELP